MKAAAPAPPVVWSIAGTDSGGGAGLSADQRACDAFGVHLCPVVAAVTAQHSRAVVAVAPVTGTLLDRQLSALAEDLPPRVIKTGLLGSAEHVGRVAAWVDRLRRDGPVALVVDPVLVASSGRALADASTRAAYRAELLPRATLVTPNRREAARLLGADLQEGDCSALPALGRALRAEGAAAVALTGGDAPDVDGRVVDWIDTPHAAGWLAAPRVATPHRHGTGCTFASAAAAALALGFVAADALVFAKMATLHALRRSWPAGGGAGPVRAAEGFAGDATLLPLLSWDETPRLTVPAAGATDTAPRPLGVYAVVASAAELRRVLDAGVRTVQLRIKAASGDAAVVAAVRDAVAACHVVGAELFVNDHWDLARRFGAAGVHLGQEDLLALGDAGRAALVASGLALGISSHSPWELARALALAPRYVACGPVWPTLTKAMPWRPQGLDNLRWWCRMAARPVVAIGGLLEAGQFEAVARCGADGACAVRVLGDAPEAVVPALARAFAAGRAAWRAEAAEVGLPHASLDPS